MKSDTVDLTKVVDALEGLSRELSRLGQRVAALEAAPHPEPESGRGDLSQVRKKPVRLWVDLGRERLHS
jgi:hypothetical protein